MLDEKEIDALERRAEVLQSGAGGADKANKGSYRHKAWKGIFCGNTDDDLRTVMVLPSNSRK